MLRFSGSINKSVVLLFLLCIGCAGGGATLPEQMDSPTGELPSQEEQSSPKNVILFISDGAGPASFTLARDFLRATGVRDNLYLDEILTGSVATYSASHPITGSGSAATALSAGVKTKNLMIGVDSTGAPVTTILEKAEAAGKSTGVIVTREVTDATPAAFTAHVTNRYDFEEDIAVQQLNSGIDILAGGGHEMFVPVELGGKRMDGRNLLVEARAKGYTVAATRQEWEEADQLPILALLGRDFLPYEIDRNPALVPSLAEMTGRAIELLNSNPQGFFLMVEGSRIDIGGHANDAAAHVHDIIAYDDAVKVALDFARSDSSTLIISVSDHETGGLSIGRNYQWFPEILEMVTASHDTIVAKIELNRPATREIIREHMSIDWLTDSELSAIDSANTRNEFNYALGSIIADRTSLNWASLSHTAVDVNLYAFGPGSEHFQGHYDNTHVGNILPVLLGLE